MVQLRELHKRFFLNTIRNRQTLGVRFFLTFFVALVIGTLFLRPDFDQSGADQRVSAVFVTLLFVMFTANAFLPEVFSARPIYFREVTADMYGPGSFYMARYSADIPFVILECLILAIMTDYMVDMGTDPQGKRTLSLSRRSPASLHTIRSRRMTNMCIPLYHTFA
jgi:hypothetical protein